MKLFTEVRWNGVDRIVLVERDGFASRVHDDLTWVAGRKVSLELLADGDVNIAVHVITQHLHQDLAFHREHPL